jgi:hypothetical protein
VRRRRRGCCYEWGVSEYVREEDELKRADVMKEVRIFIDMPS